MKKLIDWFLAWGGVHRVSTQLSALDRRVSTLTKARDRSSRELDKNLSDLKKDKERIDDRLRKTQKAVARADGLNKKLEIALDAAQAKIATLRDTVEGVVAANRVFVNRWEAETAVQARRKVVADGQQHVEEL